MSTLLVSPTAPGYSSLCTVLFYDMKMSTEIHVSSDTESLCAKCVSLRLSLSLGSSIPYSVYGKERLHVFGLKLLR